MLTDEVKFQSFIDIMFYLVLQLVSHFTYRTTLDPVLSLL